MEMHEELSNLFVVVVVVATKSLLTPIANSEIDCTQNTGIVVNL